MKKRIAAFMSVFVVVLFLSFNVHADEVIDSTRRYNWISSTNNYGNVSVTGNLFCLSDNPAMQSVNLSTASYIGNGTTTSQLSTWESVYLWKFHASYVLNNNSDTYEIFDGGRLATSFSVNAVASSNTSGNLIDSISPSGWYIDNIQGANFVNATQSGTLFFTVDDNVYAQDLIIAPGETITFSFDINIFWWEQSFGVGGTTFSCNNGSINNTISYTTGLPTSYQSLSVYEFITSQDFPSLDVYIASNINDIWSSVTTLVSQGVITNNELSDIINIINSHTLLNNTYTLSGYNTIRNSSTSTASSVARTTSVFTTNPYIVDREFSNYNGYADYDVIVCVPYYRFYSLNNTRSDISVISASDYSRCYNPLTITSNYNYLGSKVEYLSGEGMLPTGITDQYRFWFQPSQGNRFILGPNARYYYFWVEYLYFGYSGSSVPTFNFTISSTISSDPGSFNTYTDDIIDTSNDIHSEVDNQHAQEEQYYSNTNTAIADTGISNYSFDSSQVGGLNGVSDDFTAVWNACGSLNSVWVFSITLSLALFILRHKRISTS